MSNNFVLPFSITLFTVYFLLPCSLGAYYRYRYDPYYQYDFGYAKLPSSVSHITVAVPPPPPLKKSINGKLYSRMDAPFPYYAYGRHSLYWHPKFQKKALKEEKPSEMPETKLFKRNNDEAMETTASPPKKNKDELAIAFLTPGKEQVKEFKKKMDELKNSTALEEKSQKYADEMEKFSPKPSILKMGYKILNWYKGYNESPAPFYSDPRTFNHPFGNKNKMLKIPPAAFATHYFHQDVPLVTKSKYKSATKSWYDSDNISSDEMRDMSEERRDSEREKRPKCTKGTDMLYCNGDALTEFMGALERHVKKKSRSNKQRGYGGRSRYTDDDFLPYRERETSREAYEKAKEGYTLTDFYPKGNSKYKYVSSEDYYDSYDEDKLNANLDDYDVDIKKGGNPVKIVVVLTKKDFSGSSYHSRSSAAAASTQQNGIYPPKIVYDTPTLIAGKHREVNSSPDAWEDPSLDPERDSGEYTPRTKSYSQYDDYNYDRHRPIKNYDYDRPKKSSSRRNKNRQYDKLMDELMTTLEGRIQDIDPSYQRNKVNHNPSQINENDYEPAPFWPVPRDFTSEERLKYARLKAAKAAFNGPEIGWFNRS